MKADASSMVEAILQRVEAVQENFRDEDATEAAVWSGGDELGGREDPHVFWPRWSLRSAWRRSNNVGIYINGLCITKMLSKGLTENST